MVVRSFLTTTLIDKQSHMNTDKINILYIDDEPDNLTVFKFSFMQHYNVFVSELTTKAEEIISNYEIKVILVDYKMPEEDGIAFAMRIQEKYPYAIKILVTAFTESDVAIKAVNSQSFYGFVSKPWEYEQLRITIKNAIDKYDLEKQNRQLIENLKESLENEKRASKVKDIFLQNISHEIRTPLNGILGFSSLIMNNSQYPELQSKLDVIVQSGKRLLHTMQSIIESSIIVAGKLKYTGSEFLLKQVIKEAIDEFYMDELHSERTQIKCNNYPNTICENDFAKIKMILSKLLDNAYKYSPSPKQIEINIDEIVNDDCYLIKILNNGDKIPEESYNDIFDSFMNADNSLNRTHQGIGLGLYIAKSYSEYLGGKIWFEQFEGHNIFCLTIKKDNSNM